MNTVERLQEIRALEQERAAEKAAFTASQDASAKRLYDMRRSLAIASTGLDEGKISRGKEILELRGRFSKGGDDRKSVVDDAITYFIEGPKPHKNLRTMYFGTKVYDRWHGQRCDCKYGYGPTYGGIIFSIGLNRNFRDTELSMEDVEACVYTLTFLEAIQDAEASVVA